MTTRAERRKARADRRSGYDRRSDIDRRKPVTDPTGSVPYLLGSFLVALVSGIGDGSAQAAQRVGANLMIFGTYLFIGVFIAPWVRTRYLVTKLSGAVFFITCGITHLLHSLAEGGMSGIGEHPLLHTANHNVQAVAAATFAYTLWREFVMGYRTWPPRLDFARMFGRRA